MKFYTEDGAMFRIGRSYMNEQSTMGHNVIVETFYNGETMRYEKREARA